VFVQNTVIGSSIPLVVLPLCPCLHGGSKRLDPTKRDAIADFQVCSQSVRDICKHDSAVTAIVVIEQSNKNDLLAFSKC
jgi:hypothetical protein